MTLNFTSKIFRSTGLNRLKQINVLRGVYAQYYCTLFFQESIIFGLRLNVLLRTFLKYFKNNLRGFQLQMFLNIILRICVHVLISIHTNQPEAQIRVAVLFGHYPSRQEGI